MVARNSKSDLPLQVVVFYFMSNRIMIICPVCVKNPHLKKKIVGLKEKKNCQICFSHERTYLFGITQHFDEKWKIVFSVSCGFILGF